VSTTSAAAPPGTLAGWRTAYEAGARPSARLAALRQRLAARGTDPALIHLIAEDRLGARCAALERAAAGLDRTALARRMPLFGVPFAVKDNICPRRSLA
jgi:Asp-tRNA(Asn)/Glu-tRNA(Gln) amidotransferase A subunit family amidase